MAVQDQIGDRPHTLLVSFGNPLLDMTAVVKDQSLHDKFNLPVDGQLEVDEKQRALFSLVAKQYPVEYTAGGCALNSSRVFCWVLGEPQRVVFVGGIGKDEEAKRLSDITQDSGVVTRFVEVDDLPTGSCVALVLGSGRCLCADIGAASVCEPEHVFTKEFLPILEESKYIYVEGYFITHSFKTALQLAKYAQEHQKTFVFNLCGSYVCENHPDELAQLLPYVDILFGNAEEYKTLARFVDVDKILSQVVDTGNSIIPDYCQALRVLRGLENPTKDKIKDVPGETEGIVNEVSDVSDNIDFDHCNSVSTTEVIKELCNDISHAKIDECKSIKKQRFVVVTNGPNPIVYIQNGAAHEHLVPPISAKKIVDTIGAGDSFVGGFLAALIRGLPLDQCLDCGTWTAQKLLQQKGCTLPSYPATFPCED